VSGQPGVKAMVGVSTGVGLLGADAGVTGTTGTDDTEVAAGPRPVGRPVGPRASRGADGHLPEQRPDGRLPEPGPDAAPVEHLPELRFVRPLPGFAELTRFVLVRLNAGEGAEAADDPQVPDAGQPDAGQDGAGVGESGEPDSGVLFELCSLERPEVRFLVAVPGAFFPGYAVELDDGACVDLGLRDSGDALILVILTVGGNSAHTTANLLAPVVINNRTRAAAQIILSGSDWPVRATVG